MIKQGNKIKVHYTGTLDDGTIFDSSEGKEPLEFEAGAGQMIKGFDQAVIGMKVGEEKTIKIPPEEAYGEYNKELTQKVPKDKIPAEAKVGDTLVISTMQGQRQAKIIEMNDNEVTLDLNHPLAGKTLTFKITIVEVN